MAQIFDRRSNQLIAALKEVDNVSGCGWEAKGFLSLLAAGSACLEQYTPFGTAEQQLRQGFRQVRPESCKIDENKSGGAGHGDCTYDLANATPEDRKRFEIEARLIRALRLAALPVEQWSIFQQCQPASVRRDFSVAALRQCFDSAAVQSALGVLPLYMPSDVLSIIGEYAPVELPTLPLVAGSRKQKTELPPNSLTLPAYELTAADVDAELAMAFELAAAERHKRRTVAAHYDSASAAPSPRRDWSGPRRMSLELEDVDALVEEEEEGQVAKEERSDLDDDYDECDETSARLRHCKDPLLLQLLLCEDEEMSPGDELLLVPGVVLCNHCSRDVLLGQEYYHHCFTCDVEAVSTPSSSPCAAVSNGGVRGAFRFCDECVNENTYKFQEEFRERAPAHFNNDDISDGHALLRVQAF